MGGFLKPRSLTGLAGWVLWLLSALLGFAYAMHRSRVGLFEARGLRAEARVEDQTDSVTVDSQDNARSLRMLHVRVPLPGGGEAHGAVSEFLPSAALQAHPKGSRVAVLYLPATVHPDGIGSHYVEDVLLASSVSQVRRRSPALLGAVALALGGAACLLFQSRRGSRPARVAPRADQAGA